MLVCACVCVRMSTITHAHASALLAKYTQLHLTVRMCVCVSVCESNNLNKYFVHCHLGYSVLFVVIRLFLIFLNKLKSVKKTSKEGWVEFSEC